MEGAYVGPDYQLCAQTISYEEEIITQKENRVLLGKGKWELGILTQQMPTIPNSFVAI